MPDYNTPSALQADLDALARQLQHEAQASAQEALLFINWLQYKPVTASQLVYTPGRRINYIYFVQQGLLRLFRTQADGTEQTLSFHTTGEWLIDPYSFIENQPTQLHLQALEPGSLLVINRTFINRAMQQLSWYPAWQQQQLNRQLAILQQHLALLREAGAYLRYRKLQVAQPDLLERIPNEFLAGYLGVTVEELRAF